MLGASWVPRRVHNPVLLFLGVFVSLVFFLLRKSLVFWVFSAYFTGFYRVREVVKILGVFEVFLGIYEKTKEKKHREVFDHWPPAGRLPPHQRGHRPKNFMFTCLHNSC